MTILTSSLTNLASSDSPTFTGNVGIGTTSPAQNLQIVDNVSVLAVTSSDTSAGTASIFLGDTDDINVGYIQYDNSTNFLRFGANAAERMRIDASGNVGIGTTSPQADLTVSDGGAEGLEVDVNATIPGTVRLLAFDRNLNQDIAMIYRADRQIFQSGGSSEAMRIDAAGNIGIGTNSPSTKLHIADVAPRITTQATNGVSGLILDVLGAGSALLRVNDDGTERIRIDGSGNVGIGTSSPVSPLEVSKGRAGGFVANLVNTDTGGSSNGLRVEVSNNSTVNTVQRWLVSGTEVARVGANGNVGIGTTSPSSRLEVSETVSGGTSQLLVLRNSASSVPGTGAEIFFTPVADNARGCFIRSESGVGNENSLLFGTNTFGNTPAERMRIDASGNVGIGANNPQYKLDVRDTGDVGIRVFREDGTRNGRLEIKQDNQGGVLNQTYNSTASNLRFQIAANEAMRINASGELLIGTTTSTGSGGVSFVQDGAGTAQIINRTSTATTTHIQFRNPNGIVGSIQTNGTTTAFNTSSDARLKENVQDAGSAGNIIDNIKIRQFDWIADGVHDDYGVVAQELEQVYPKAVSTDDTEEEMKSVDYSKLVPLLVKEIQDLRSQVSNCLSEIETLKNKNN